MTDTDAQSLVARLRAVAICCGIGEAADALERAAIPVDRVERPDLVIEDETAPPPKPDAESDAALLLRLGDDASKWAAEFRRTAVRLGYSDMDEGWLISWFANAIEHSESVRSAASQPAAPPAPEPPAEVEWRVSEKTYAIRVKELKKRPHNDLVIDYANALETIDRLHHDARAALARRPDSTLATSVGDDTLAVLDVLKARYGMTRNSDVLKRVLADAKKTVEGYVLPPLTGPTPATPVIDETRELVAQWDGHKMLSDEWRQAEHKLRSGALMSRFRSILAEHDAVAARRPGGWQDMEGAPIDEHVLISTKDHGLIVARQTTALGWIMQWGLDDWIGVLPEGWMPLPAPPAENEEDRG